MNAVAALLALLAIWDYPARFPAHEALRRQFVAAVREGDTATMEETCRKGVTLLPEDPTWRFNLACSLAYFERRQTEALDALEEAIDLGFRDRAAIEGDRDLKRLADLPRFRELLDYADFMKPRPMLSGPLSSVAATGIFGKTVVLGEQNLDWDFDTGCFVAKIRLAVGTDEPSVGDLYMNRDGQHAALDIRAFPGLTPVRLDEDGRRHRADLSFPNMLFPYPVFGNASLAMTQGPYWRSLSRALLTVESHRLNAMAKLYLSNQTWVFPSNADTAPVGTNGDVFASIAPFWMTTAGRSRSDLPYLRAALEASRSFPPKVKSALVAKGLLAPTIQTLIRKSLKGVMSEADYLTARAHPTALPPDGCETNRLADTARRLTPEAVPPLVPVAVAAEEPAQKAAQPELTYATAFAWAYVLRANDERRTFLVSARGAQEFAFVQTHGAASAATIERVKPDAARVTIRRSGLSPTNRVDVAVFGRNAQTGWGAPSYVSFARMDPSAPYSDPALTVLAQPTPDSGKAK